MDQFIQDFTDENFITFMCMDNYRLLLISMKAEDNPGLAQCSTPIREADLHRLLAWMNDQGWDAGYQVVLGGNGQEYVQVYWDVAKQYPNVEPRRGTLDSRIQTMAGLIYNERDKNKRPAEGDLGQDSGL